MRRFHAQEDMRAVVKMGNGQRPGRDRIRYKESWRTESIHFLLWFGFSRVDI